MNNRNRSRPQKKYSIKNSHLFQSKLQQNRRLSRCRKHDSQIKIEKKKEKERKKNASYCQNYDQDTLQPVTQQQLNNQYKIPSNKQIIKQIVILEQSNIQFKVKWQKVLKITSSLIRFTGGYNPNPISVSGHQLIRDKMFMTSVYLIICQDRTVSNQAVKQLYQQKFLKQIQQPLTKKRNIFVKNFIKNSQLSNSSKNLKDKKQLKRQVPINRERADRKKTIQKVFKFKQKSNENKKRIFNNDKDNFLKNQNIDQRNNKSELKKSESLSSLSSNQVLDKKDCLQKQYKIKKNNFQKFLIRKLQINQQIMLDESEQINTLQDGKYLIVKLIKKDDKFYVGVMINNNVAQLPSKAFGQYDKIKKKYCSSNLVFLKDKQITTVSQLKSQYNKKINQNKRQKKEDKQQFSY